MITWSAVAGFFAMVWVCGLFAGCMREAPPPADADAWEARRQAMVALLQAQGVRDAAVLAAMARVPRHRFVPEAYRDTFDPYGDHPGPIGYGQTISQPFVVAYMTERMQLKPGEHVLEIGTGSGYQAAILAEIGVRTFSIEIVPGLADHARAALAAQGYGTVAVRTGDGYLGWPEEAPFDVIIVTCAPTEVPPALVAQLRDGGRMILPLGDEHQRLVILRKRGERLDTEQDLPVRFVPMVGGP